MSKETKLGLERSPFASDKGELIGRDPQAISAKEWHRLRSDFPVGLQAVRAKCLECAYTPGEVRKCVCVECPLWPFRLGSVPKGYRKAREQVAWHDD